MDIVKAWGVAIVTYLLGSLLFGWVAAAAGDPEQINSGVGHVLWSLVPTLVLYLLTAVLATIFHGRDHTPARHALAVLTIPAVVLLISVVGGLVSGSVSLGDTAMSAVVAIVATVAGWQLVDRIRGTTSRSQEDTYWW